MSYETMDALMADEAFAGRVRACMAQVALDHLDDAEPASAYMAADVLRGGAMPATVMARLVAVAPGVADGLKAQGGTVNQAAVPDATISDMVSANWQEVVRLAYRASPLAPGALTWMPGQPIPPMTAPLVGTPSASGVARPLTGP